MAYAFRGGDGSEIAVVGLACRFPRAKDEREFWALLRDGAEGIRTFSDDELLAAGLDPELIQDPDYVKAAGELDGIDRFDANFFGYTPQEAATLDPQQRLFLQEAWKALENAGIDPGRNDSAIGVFAGIGHSEYLFSLSSSSDFEHDPAGRFALITGNDKDFVATRLAYKLNLSGPALTVQTACSTSLVAVHLACQSLLNGESDTVLAGGVSLRVPHPAGYLYQEGMIASPDGHCRPFDEKAAGIVPSEGVAVIVLKRLEDALEEGDRIRAVIRGSAINNDGSEKIGYTAPSVQGQSRVIQEALAVSGIDPSQIGYVEAHGTGTSLGDPIEIEALNKVFASPDRTPGSMLVGSVKSNLGHTDTAAGVASVIKTVLALEHRHIPATLHFQSPNPKIRFADGPFRVCERLTPWTAIDGIRLAGISSFGIGGTNAHLVIQEAPDWIEEPESKSDLRPFALSAKTNWSLRELAKRYADALIERPDLRLEDIAHTIDVGRARFPETLLLAASTTEEMYRDLRTWLDDEGQASTLELHCPSNAPKLAFLFTGQGAQTLRMGCGLLKQDPGFRANMERCDSLFAPHLGGSLLEVIDPSEGDAEAKASKLNETGWTQPALFALEYSLAQYWRERGVVPDALLGHSIGEIAAACFAGVFSLEDAVTLVAHRASLMQALPKDGSMAVLFTEEESLTPLLEAADGQLAIAARNAPGSIVISGTSNAVTEVCARAKEKGIGSRELTVSHAFHSPLMEPMLDTFRDKIAAIHFQSPNLPLVSNLTGEVAGAEIATPDYWVRQVRETVRFQAGVETLLNQGFNLFLELGPRPVLCQLGRQTADAVGSECGWIPTLVPASDDSKRMMLATGALQRAGIKMGEDQPSTVGRIIDLPTYPFDERSYWLAPPASSRQVQTPHIYATANAPASEAGQNRVPNMVSPSESNTVHKTDVLEALTDEVKSLTGVSVDEDKTEVNLFHLGIDSLMLVRIRQAIKKRFGVSLPMAQFYSDLDSLSKIADAVSAQVPQVPTVTPAQSPRTMQSDGGNGASTPVRTAPANLPQGRADASVVERVAAMQIEEMSRFMAHQLEVLSGSLQGSTPAEAPAKRVPSKEAPEYRPQNLSMFQNFEAEHFTVEQQAFLDDLIGRYTKRTPKSKDSIETYRPCFSDWINAVNFRFSLKEILYPIVVHQSKGARLWDIDGNEYLDLAMGYGVNFLGNRPDFVEKAIEKQLHEGIQLGPQFDMTGETAKMLCDLIGVERVTFTNTGTEAMMVAVRIARAATGRKTIVVFQGSYHGMFDGLMVAPSDEGTLPAFPGIPEGMVEDVIMLNYGSEDSLEEIRKLGPSLAGVIVEPVQSRRPGFQPREFLHSLRDLADKDGFALVFDEIITGFRVSPGGAQEYFDVRADIVGYGKVIGGGMPIGIIAGKSRFMDFIDGGTWKYGDRSHPESGTTIFAGTFCKHPLTIASMHAVLSHLTKEGPKLQERVNAMAARLVDTLNDFFVEQDVPIRIRRFASQFRFESFGEYDLAKNPIEMELLFYLLMLDGIYTWERHICFLSTAHTDDDVDRVIERTKAAVMALRAGGFSFSSNVKTGLKA
ncbi:aminotransferase class III-fold pyridoxal phosphate-dependent enzyme [bacterium]|nr:aminotransferase class III-fold pyridoxal phosphate-dependent enzyme [bacterium]